MHASTSIAHWHILKSKVIKPSGWDDPIAHRWRSILEMNWDKVLDKPSPLVVDATSKQLSMQRALLRASRSHPQEDPLRSTKRTLHIPSSRLGHNKNIHTTVEPLRGSDAPGDKADKHHRLDRSKVRRIIHGRRSTWVEKFLVRWEPETCTFGDTLDHYQLGFYIVSITSLEKTIFSHSLQPFVSAKRLDQAKRRALRRPPLTTRCIVQYAPSPHDPRHILSIAGRAQALDIFLAREALSLPPPNPLAKVEQCPPPIKRSLSVQAPTRTMRGKHPGRGRAPSRTHAGGEHTSPASFARQPRRPHNDLLHIVTVEGDPDRDSIPRPRPYNSLVPPASPWNTHGKCMFGIHMHIGAAISPTLLSPQRYKWLHETHLRLHNHTDFT